MSRIGKEVVTSPLSRETAVAVRDSAAKTIYGKLFNWILARVNAKIKTNLGRSEDQVDSESIYTLGLLDIFGFETFKRNSFEQLCINYCNEKLQSHFNEHMIALELQQYRHELGDHAVGNITFSDNFRCLELFESVSMAAPSIFQFIDEQGSLGANGNDTNVFRRI